MRATVSGQICVRDLKLQGQQRDPACPWGSQRELFCWGQCYCFCMEGNMVVKARGCSQRGPTQPSAAPTSCV